MEDIEKAMTEFDKIMQYLKIVHSRELKKVADRLVEIDDQLNNLKKERWTILDAVWQNTLKTVEEEYEA